MNKINKTQQYAILWLNDQGMETIKIADELKLTEKQVLSVLEKGVNKNISKESTVKTVKSSANSKSKNLMITKTAAKGNNSVSIMTQEASELNDSMKKNLNNQSRKSQDNIIYRPNR